MSLEGEQAQVQTTASQVPSPVQDSVLTTGLSVPQKRKQFNIADRQLLSVDSRHEEEEMAYIETKPCQLPGGLGNWHPPTPDTKDGHGNISSMWLHSCISNATWIIAVRAPEGQFSSVLQPVPGTGDTAHRKKELGEDRDCSPPSPVLVSASLCVHTANMHREKYNMRDIIT